MPFPSEGTEFTPRSFETVPALTDSEFRVLLAGKIAGYFVEYLVFFVDSRLAMVHPLDQVENLTNALAEDIPYSQSGSPGFCRGWPCKQDRMGRRSGDARLAVNERDIIVEASTLLRMPREGDQFTLGGLEYRVRPRGDEVAYSQADRAGLLLRISLVR